MKMEAAMTRLVLQSALAIAFAFTSSGVAPAVASPATGVTARNSVSFTVDNAPAGAWDVYLGYSDAPPGAWPGPHTHPGPEYGFVLSGVYYRWSEGVTYHATAGQRYFSPMGVIHEGGNAGDANAQFFSTHILSAGGAFNTPADPALAPGAPKAVAGQITIYRVKFPMATHPATPFKLTMELLDFTETGQSVPHMLAGTLLGVVVNGQIAVTVNGTTTTYAQNAGFSAPAGATVSLAAANGAPATVALSVLGS
jgi:quercetin dioxygenase-like cupin family protein